MRPLCARMDAYQGTRKDCWLSGSVGAIKWYCSHSMRFSLLFFGCDGDIQDIFLFSVSTGGSSVLVVVDLIVRKLALC